MSERLTKVQEEVVRLLIGNGMGDQLTIGLLAELDATRAERDAAVRERDLLAGLLERLSLNTHDIMLPSGKHVVCDENCNWYVSGEEGTYETQIDAIRAAMSNNTKEQ